MFAPTQDEVRRFFCGVQRRILEGLPLSPLQDQAARWVREHPEYEGALADEEAAVQARYEVEDGSTNPFLHLSMHLSLDEQIAINQPTGVREAFEALAARCGSAHEAHHRMMECLGRMIWESQRRGLPPDGHAYLDCLYRQARR